MYPGMVIGESSKSQDMYLNPTVKKQLTNIRAAGADDKVRCFVLLPLPTLLLYNKPQADTDVGNRIDCSLITTHHVPGRKSELYG